MGSKRFYKKQNIKGLTLIELVISIGILSIVAISILQMFGSGFVKIVGAGSHSKAQFVAQEAVEQDLNNRTITADTDTIEIALISTLIEVDGEIKSHDATMGSRTVTIEYFKPHR